MKRHLLYSILIIFATLQVSSETMATYTYDSLNRLTRVIYSNGVTVNYTYDALGNRTKKVLSATHVQGDVNGNGIVSIDDLSALIDMLLNDDTNSNGDVNNDGTVSIDDLSALIDILLQQ